MEIFWSDFESEKVQLLIDNENSCFDYQKKPLHELITLDNFYRLETGQANLHP